MLPQDTIWTIMGRVANTQQTGESSDRRLNEAFILTLVVLVPMANMNHFEVFTKSRVNSPECSPFSDVRLSSMIFIEYNKTTNLIHDRLVWIL